MGYNIWWRRPKEEVRLAIHVFLPGLNASPGYRGGSLRNNAGHGQCCLAVACNNWDMIILCDEMFTREGEKMRSQACGRAESMKGGVILWKDKHIYISTNCRIKI